MAVYRIYVEKKPEFAVESKAVLSDLRTSLRLEALENVRIINRYDAENISGKDFIGAENMIFAEPPVDTTFSELPSPQEDEHFFAVEFLPGQYDQRADSCAQCIQFVTQGERPSIRTAKVYVLKGKLSQEDVQRIKSYLINSVESRETTLDTFTTLETHYDIPQSVETLTGFIALDEQGLRDFIGDYRLAMDYDDIVFCQSYFKDEEQRDPTITEVRMIDTYWSDHCRHTTFLTNIDKVTIDAPYIDETYRDYVSAHKEMNAAKNRPITLMDLATIAAKRMRQSGKLVDLDQSEEINACSVKIKVDVNGKMQDWLLMFKNETHNHPTEIEPFGGAATCLGGAIRDPLSGRSYVYQAMRVTGSGNPLVPVEDTIPHKLPQRKITVGAAHGYSSYGNQIGLCTGQVSEIYHKGYIAKRMEIGAVIGAAPAKNVVRVQPEPGDAVILLGGRTGRDGCGGATGSSKSHTSESLESCGAEVQKGNAPEERKIQRLFRNPMVTQLIKRCNDFGAGGVSVAIGELADGLTINLDAVPKKYDGLDGTELAISESQERMAVVVASDDVNRFIDYAQRENIEATRVATVTAQPRLKMTWNGNTIVNIAREFLNSNGAEKHTEVHITEPVTAADINFTNTHDGWISLMSDLNVCSQKGLAERFDSTIGAGSVLMPFGGVHQLTPTQAMVAKIPVVSGNTNTCSAMSWGFNPYLSEKSPYHGAMYAVIESIAKLVATGASANKCWLTFQEYFERPENDPTRWGKPFAALLGAYKAQLELGCASIGGKDSMSGTYENIDVPPTLVSFAVSVTDAGRVMSPEFKQVGSNVILISPEYDENGLPNFKTIRQAYSKVENLISNGAAKAVYAVSYGGIAEAVAKMCFGNRIGFCFSETLSDNELFLPSYGSFVVEIEADRVTNERVIGHTTAKEELNCKDFVLTLDELLDSWQARLEPIFPCNVEQTTQNARTFEPSTLIRKYSSTKFAKPRVLIPVFPGTNCEYDSARAFEVAGAAAEIMVIKNLTPANITESVNAMENLIDSSQIIMLPGGFSAGDEPDGSAKFITAFFRNPRLKDAIHRLLLNRDGLMLGICNGFQALIKLGLLPGGMITEITEASPTLTYNTIGRHQSKLIRTRVVNNNSPWLTMCKVDEIHTIPISHGEGRFYASSGLVNLLDMNGQIATQYVDMDGNPTMDIRYNPNASIEAIEGITSPDGRILGKMGHSERIGDYLYKNVPSNNDQQLFQGGVNYFK